MSDRIRNRCAPLTATPLLAALLLVWSGPVAGEEVNRILAGPPEGWGRVTIQAAEARVHLRVSGEEPAAGEPVAEIRYQATAMDFLVPDPGEVVSPGQRPMMVARVEGDALELLPEGDPPGREARLAISLQVTPRAVVELQGERFELEANGPWAVPEPPTMETREGPGGRRAHRRRTQTQIQAPPPVPPAQASLQVAASFARVQVDGWPGALSLKARTFEVRGQHLGGALEVGPGRGDVELREVGGRGSVHTSGGDVYLEKVLQRAAVHVNGGDLHLLDVAGEVEAEVTGGALVLREIGKRAQVKVNEGTLMASGVGGPLGGTLTWVEAVVTEVRGGLNLRLEEGSLQARGIIASLRLHAEETAIDLLDLRGTVQIAARGTGPVKVVDARSTVTLDLEDTEATVERVLKPLKVVQVGGTLKARQIGGEPDLDLRDVELEYVATNRYLLGGRFRLMGGEGLIRLPRRTVLALSGDTERVRTNLTTRDLDDLDRQERRKGHHVTLEVDGADVEVRALP
jgi:hypothetical protein